MRKSRVAHTEATSYELAALLMWARQHIQTAVDHVRQYVEESGDGQAEGTILAYLEAVIASDPPTSGRDTNINVWIERVQYGDDFYPEDEPYDEDMDYE